MPSHGSYSKPMSEQKRMVMRDNGEIEMDNELDCDSMSSLEDVDDIRCLRRIVSGKHGF